MVGSYHSCPSSQLQDQHSPPQLLLQRLLLPHFLILLLVLTTTPNLHDYYHCSAAAAATTNYYYYHRDTDTLAAAPDTCRLLRKKFMPKRVQGIQTSEERLAIKQAHASRNSCASCSFV